MRVQSLSLVVLSAVVALVGCGRRGDCERDADCPAGQRCDTAAGACVAAAQQDAGAELDAGTAAADAGDEPDAGADAGLTQSDAGATSDAGTATDAGAGAWPFGIDGPLTVPAGARVSIPNGAVKDFSTCTIAANGTLEIEAGEAWTVIGCAEGLVLDGTLVAKSAAPGTGSPVVLNAPAE
ncbi:MAG: hypothetical protein ACK4N5_26865, partial [Myxococcales bacterium]